MSKKYKRYTKEFKLEAIWLVETEKVKSSNKHKRNVNINYPFKFFDTLIF